MEAEATSLATAEFCKSLKSCFVKVGLAPNSESNGSFATYHETKKGTISILHNQVEKGEEYVAADKFIMGDAVCPMDFVRAPASERERDADVEGDGGEAEAEDVAVEGDVEIGEDAKE